MRSARSTRPGSWTTSWRCPSTCGTPSGGSSRPGSSPLEASGLIVCGMGGSAVGGVLARAALGDVLNRPMLIFRDYELPSWTGHERAVLCSSYSGDTEETLACFEAAEAVGAHRFAMTTGGALGDAARKAGVPVIGLARGAAAPPLGRLRLHRRLRGRGPRRRRTGDADGDRHGRRPPRRGPGRPCRPRRRGRRADRRVRAADLRLRPDGPRGLPVEVRDQRERQAPRVRQPAARDRPQRDRRLGPERERHPLRRRLPRRSRSAPAPARARRAHREADRARGRLRRRGRDRG